MSSVKIRKLHCATSASSSVKVFVNPVGLGDLSLQKMRLALCKFIRLGDSGAFPKAHDLRKWATSFAFFKSMKSQEMCSLVGWSNIKTFKRYYMKPISEVASSFMALGTKIPSEHN